MLPATKNPFLKIKIYFLHSTRFRNGLYLDLMLLKWFHAPSTWSLSLLLLSIPLSFSFPLPLSLALPLLHSFPLSLFLSYTLSLFHSFSLILFLSSTPFSNNLSIYFSLLFIFLSLSHLYLYFFLFFFFLSLSLSFFKSLIIYLYLLPFSWFLLESLSFLIYLQGGPKKNLWCDLEEKCLWNSKIFFDGVFLCIYSHLLKKLELFELNRKKVIGL